MFPPTIKNVILIPQQRYIDDHESDNKEGRVEHDFVPHVEANSEYLFLWGTIDSTGGLAQDCHIASETLTEAVSFEPGSKINHRCS